MKMDYQKSEMKTRSGTGKRRGIAPYTVKDLERASNAARKTSCRLRTRAETLNQAKIEALGEFFYRRVAFPFKPPFLFDCRFNGAGEQLVQNRYVAFLDRLQDVATDVKDTGMMNTQCDDTGVDVLTAIREMRGLGGTGANAVMESVRLRYLDEERKRTGRDITDEVVRRMGIGDQVVLVGILQSVTKAVGDKNVTVVYDPHYPGSREIFQMSGLQVMPIQDGRPLPMSADATVISLRPHILEHPLNDSVPCFYGEECGDPSAQVLWNLGWEEIFPDHKAAMARLTPSAKHDREARKLLHEWGITEYVCAQPLETTRGNVYATPLLYSAMLQRTKQGVVLYGAGKRDVGRLRAFVEAMEMPKETAAIYVHESLGVWLSLMRGASEIVTGNTSGMWLGFASGSRMTILTKSESCHGRMWIPHDGWFDEERMRSVYVIS